MGANNKQHGVSRRKALRTLATSAGAAASALWVGNLTTLAQTQAMDIHLAASASLQTGGAFRPAVLTAAQFETVGVLVELIIPATDTPGAKALLVDRFVDGVLETATPADRDRFVAGLGWLDTRSSRLSNKTFAQATAAQQTDLLTRLSAEPSSEEASGVQFFTAIKAMTITGYYTTEVGLRQELGDDGRLMLAAFEGCTHAEHQ
ncbi:MAG: gluconate 2-dehydrogenase subunit 3 family protein [Vicinamibacterales bacterium]